MKKGRIILVEALVLIALILVACVICKEMVKAPDDAQPAAATEPTATEPTETEPAPTEPPEPIVPTWLVMDEGYTLSCREYFVYDVAAGVFADSSGVPADTKIYPASITKLFTTYVALQYLTPETQVTVGAEITMIDPDSTTAQLQQGDVVTVHQLVGGMLLPSGNDAAYAMAAAAGRVIKGDPDCSAWTAVSAFVEEMNKQAAALGMTGSHFCNPDGIHQDDHYLSLEDMALVGELSLQNPIVMEYAGRATESVQIGDRSVFWKNTNLLIRRDLPMLSQEELGPYLEMEHWDQLYCEYAVGLKTGRTTPAGCCLLSAFEVRGRQLVIGVFGCDEGEARFTDTLHLLNNTLELT